MDFIPKMWIPTRHGMKWVKNMGEITPRNWRFFRETLIIQWMKWARFSDPNDNSHGHFFEEPKVNQRWFCNNFQPGFLMRKICKSARNERNTLLLLAPKEEWGMHGSMGEVCPNCHISQLVGGIPTPLKNMKVNSKDFPRYYGKYKMFQTTNQV